MRRKHCNCHRKLPKGASYNYANNDDGDERRVSKFFMLLCSFNKFSSSSLLPTHSHSPRFADAEGKAFSSSSISGCFKEKKLEISSRDEVSVAFSGEGKKKSSAAPSVQPFFWWGDLESPDPPLLNTDPYYEEEEK